MRSSIVALLGLSVLAGPALAGEVGPDMVSTGVADFYNGIISSDLTNPGSDLTDAEGYLLGLDGYYNGWLSGNTAVQADLNVEGAAGLNYEPGIESSSLFVSGGTHMAYRDPDQWAAALFVAAQRALYHGSGAGDLVPYALVGVEAQGYFDDLTVYVQGGVALGEPAPDLAQSVAFLRHYGNFAFVRGVLRYFPTDNIRLSAEGLYGEGQVGYWAYDGGALMTGAYVPTTIGSVKLSADYRPDGSDASFFAAYEAGFNSQSVSGVTRTSLDQKATIGFKVDFGAPDLKTRDRQGVTWDLPKIADLVGQGDKLDYCFIGDCFPNNVPLPP